MSWSRKPITVQFRRGSERSDPTRSFVIFEGEHRYVAARERNSRQIDAIERGTGDRYVIDPISGRSTFQRHAIRWLPLEQPIRANKYRRKSNWRNFVICSVYERGLRCPEPVAWVKMPGTIFFCQKHHDQRERSRAREAR